MEHMRRHRIPAIGAAVALTLAAFLGWLALTEDQWHGPCRPQFPGSPELADALPEFACFTVDGNPQAGYVVHLSYSDQQHAPEDNLRLAYQEVGVFWRKFPYPVYGFDINPDAAYGESAIGKLYLSDDVVKAKLGSRPASLKMLSGLPAQPTSTLQSILWSATSLSAAGGLALAGLTIRRVRRSRHSR